MQNKRRTAIITLLAFLINVMLPFMATYNVSQAHAGDLLGVESVFGEKILICTADGFTWVTLADLQSGKESPEPHPQFKCPLCYVAAGGATHTLPSDAAGLFNSPTAKQLKLLFVLAKQLKSQYSVSNRLSRAPPQFIIA